MIRKTEAIEKPPVVTIMGHVDHGKTTLLDAIRKSRLVQKESGGITQHIGAYQILYHGKKITFIDTPGHAAFSQMRARGAQATDLVVLVVAANEGVKPQTKESIAHINQAKAPFLVAINKVDLPEADINRVKGQLAEAGVLVEGFGGQTVAVEISAKTGQGVDQLLEMILLMAQLKELKADPKRELSAIIIESSLDQKKGPLATVIVEAGILHTGDWVQAGSVNGRVKAIYDDLGNNLDQIGPGDPGQILGLKGVAETGTKLIPCHGIKVKEEKCYERPYQKINKKEIEAEKETETEKKPSPKVKIKIIFKADTLGTLEAIRQNVSDEIEIIHVQVGAVNESDIMLAQATGAVIIAFRLQLDPVVARLAENERIVIKQYDLIYKLLEDMEEKVLEWLEPTIHEEITGEGKVIAEFEIKKQHICGCRILEGKMSKNDFYRVLRDSQIVGENLRTKSLQKAKQDMEEVKAVDEVGLIFHPEVDFHLGDVIISYRKNK